jgi:hypothetical protein
VLPAAKFRGSDDPIGSGYAIGRAMMEPSHAVRNEGGRKNLLPRLLGLAAMLINFPTLAAVNVPLAWNPSINANVAGYKIYYGLASHNYTQSVNVGNVTNTTIVGLSENTTYYFAATTYDAAGVESAFSNEAIYLFKALPPTLNPIGNLTLNFNSPPQTVGLSGIGSGAANELQPLSVTAISSNPKLIPNPTVNYSSPLATGTLTLRPAANASGTSVITVKVTGGASGNAITQSFTVTVETKAASGAKPMVLNKPADQIVLAGKTVSLKVSAGGKGPLKYQWQCNGTNVTGATKSTLTLKNISVKQSGLYSVAVYNSVGSAVSTPATLIVYSTPAAKLISSVTGDGHFAFNVAGVTGYKYAVQGSSDLVHWTSVQTNTAPFTFEDANSSQFTQRFYRTVYLP